MANMADSVQATPPAPEHRRRIPWWGILVAVVLVFVCGALFLATVNPVFTAVVNLAETIFRYGDDPSNGSAAKIGGGAVAGAILGAIIGGGKGAAIGATTGAAGGGAMVMAGDRSEAIFPSGAQVTARIVSPVTITVDK